MKTVLATVILATASPLAIAQHGTHASSLKTLTAAEQDAMAGAPSEAPMRKALETRIMDDALEAQLADEVHSSAIEGARRAYATSMFEPVWTEDGAESLKAMSGDLFEFGLASDNVLQADLDTLIDQRFEGDTPDARAAGDVALTAAWLRVAAAVSGGLADEGEANASNETRPSYAMLPQMLLKAGDGDAYDAVKSLEPKNIQYSRLKSSLQTYRDIRDRGGWLAIPEGEIVEAGDSDPRIPAIRKRLAAENYESDQSVFSLVSDAIEAGKPEGQSPVTSAAAASDISAVDLDSIQKVMDETRYDETLVTAVKDFQARHGIEPDGVIGPATLSAMNESVDSKIARIADSMNRWRRQGDMDKQFVWANVPSYSAEGWNNGKREIVVKTIVGTADNATPSFSDEIEYAVANPNWYAPVSIVRNEKAPKLAADPGYAQRGNYKVYDRETGAEVSAYSVNWNAPDVAEKYRLVQQSGESNALGELKIIFPNQYSIYLHDTPGKHLFDRAERAFSHGCIRLEEPTKMAQWIAEKASPGDADMIEKAVATRERQQFDFKRRIPIHITYMTVTVDEEGKASFWRDIYDRTEGIRQVEKFAPLNENDSPVQTANLKRG